MNLHVSNLDGQVTAEMLTTMFSAHGEVASAQIAMDGFTDQSRGFAFVIMPDETAAQAAIAALNGSELNGRKITVAEAAPRLEHKGSYKVGNGPVNVRPFKRS